jgi:uncharacterized protein
MQINVSQLLRDSVGSSREYKISETIDSDNEGVIIPVKGGVKLTRTNRSILVKGTLYVSMEVTCARCLDVYSQPLTLNIEEEFFPTIDIHGGYPAPPDEDQDNFIIDEHQILDLTEAIRQYTILAIPMKPLCREECNGR